MDAPLGPIYSLVKLFLNGGGVTIVNMEKWLFLNNTEGIVRCS